MTEYAVGTMERAFISTIILSSGSQPFFKETQIY